MAFSDDDDEEEALPLSVSNYYFNDEQDEAVCFSQLPLQIGGKESSIDGSKKKIFLRGTADGGLLTICKHVTAWKFHLLNVGKPEISVLSKENRWLKLQKPRKSFEPVIRSVLISVHCLHLLSRNPNLLAKSLWEQLAKTFSLYEVKPSQNDLVDHMDLIAEAVKSDASLANSKFLKSFLEEKPKKRKLADENARDTFIVDDDAVDGPELDDSNNDDEDDDLYESVCTLCDNGGNLLICDGRCMRSFHPTEDDESALESECDSLGFTPEQVKAMEVEGVAFLCKNCEYNQHQCFICGKLGSSDKSSGAEVFRCSNATCGRFYHPHCVAKLLHKGDKVAAEEHGEKILAGELFTCPTHKCCVCQQGENKKVRELQFALCRRCPKAYHRKCLPREIAFDDTEEEDVITRAWDGLLDNRVLIYCLNHEIDDDIGTPKRDHIKFPNVEGKEKKASAVHEKVGLKKKSLVLEDTSHERTAMKTAKQSFSVVKAGQTSKKSEKFTPRTSALKKLKATGASRKLMRQNSKSVPMDAGKSSASDRNKTSLGDRLFDYMNQESEQVKPGRQATLKGGLNKAAAVNSTIRSKSLEMPSLDANSERRLLDLMKEAESSVTLEDIIAKQNVPKTHGYSSRSIIDRQITLGKIDVSVEAVRMALDKLEKGCSIEDAEAVCEPEVLNQIYKWQSKLRVYLAPFLYGMRYTSFGRHFTKVDRLEEIVDRLHWYAQDGDTIVDFCCGANDFSVIMKRKLEETGKKCSFRNYDIFQAKNDFNFEKRDWMSVRPKELPTGSQLIMGLNPPFGVKAGLANKFIDKALEFNPKLLILIVPPETERLDQKKSTKYLYELVWEDNDFLSGKSFYLPGSVDTNDKQMDQWNVMAPPLYLWSRSDFSDKHKCIAEKHGHLPREPEILNQEMDIDETHISELPLEDDGHLNNASELKYHMRNHEVECKQEKSVEVTPRECSPHQQSDEKNQSREIASKKKRKRGRETDKKSEGRTPRSETHGGVPHSSPPNVVGSRSSAESASKSPDQHLNPSMHSSPIPLTTSYVDTRTSGADDMGRSYNMNNDRSLVEGASKSPIQLPNPNMHSSQIPLGASYGDTRTSVSDDMGRRYNIYNDQSSVERTSSKSPKQYLNPNMHSSQIPLGTSYGDTRTSIVDDMGRRYNMNNDPYSVGIHSHGYEPYINEMDRELNMRSQVRLYGQGRNDPAGLSSPYGPTTPSYGQQHLGAASNASYRTNTSATQRYAPRLDELNYTMMGTPGAEPPTGNRSGFYDPRPPLMTDPQAPRPSYPTGFAPGPYNPYSHNNSAGWLNE